VRFFIFNAHFGYSNGERFFGRILEIEIISVRFFGVRDFDFRGEELTEDLIGDIPSRRLLFFILNPHAGY